jgi:hypothetical protein
MDGCHDWVPSIPSFLFLGFVESGILARRDEPVHESPLGNWWAMNAGACCDRNIAICQNRMTHEMVQASRNRVNQFEAREGR